jgi:hypothetical protein
VRCGSTPRGTGPRCYYHRGPPFSAVRIHISDDLSGKPVDGRSKHNALFRHSPRLKLRLVVALTPQQTPLLGAHRAVPGGGAHALIAPYYSGGNGKTCNSVEEPLPTVTTKARFALIAPITHLQGQNWARSIEEPLPTLTTAKGGELAFVTASFGERGGQAPRVHDLDSPQSSARGTSTLPWRPSMRTAADRQPSCGTSTTACW